MKKALLFLSLLPFFTACDNIGEDERYIEVEQVTSKRKCLLEEFTGQRCTNCPDAHAVIEKLEEQYGEDLIVVSIHAGNSLISIAAPNGLKQPEGDDYAAKWGVTTYPCGIIDRSSDLMGYDAWANAVRNELTKEAALDLELEAHLSADGDKIEIATEMLSSDRIGGNLQLWITEDNIVAMQVYGSQRLPDYVHNNVYRASVNGIWGEAVSLTPNVFSTVTHSIAVDDSWNTDNLNVVAFVYDNGSVLQAAKCKVTKQ